MGITLASVKRVAREMGCTVTKSTAYGSYRVNIIGGSESTAYYTDSLSDAEETARIMGAPTHGCRHAPVSTDPERKPWDVKHACCRVDSRWLGNIWVCVVAGIPFEPMDTDEWCAEG